MNRYRRDLVCACAVAAVVVAICLVTFSAHAQKTEGGGGGRKQPGQGDATTQPSTQPSDANATKPSKTRGWISGVVHDPDDKPLANFRVRLNKQEPRGMGGGGGDKKEAAVMTDDNGNFVFKELEPGEWLMVAGSNEEGWIYNIYEVTAGAENKVGVLKLTKI